jgi:hypothetical protein
MTFDLSPPPGSRFPEPGDEQVPFEPKGALKGRVDFSEMLKFHSPTEDQFTLLATHEREISAAACFQVRDEDLYIAYLARNELFHPPTFVAAGSFVVAAVEGFAEKLQRPLLRLDSVDDPKTMEWYHRQGFTADGAPRGEPGWGTVHPMAKRVEPFGAP